MFTAKDAMLAVGMKKPNFDRWCSAGIARPTVPSQGTGYPAKWDGYDLIGLLLTKKLSNAGVTLKVAADISEELIKKKRSLEIDTIWEIAIDPVSHEVFDVPLTGVIGDNSRDKEFERWRIHRTIVLVIQLDQLMFEVMERLGIEGKDKKNYLINCR